MKANSDPYKQGYKDPNLTPIEDLYRENMKLGGEYEWRGFFDMADRHFNRAAEYKRRIEAGEIYEPNF